VNQANTIGRLYQFSEYLRNILLLIALILVLAGCGGPKVTAETPPEIRYGEDVCVRCGMIISDERYAAGLVVETEPGRFEHRIFDDIGGMFLHAAEHGDNESIVRYFVHDYHSLAWIDAQKASFVSSQSMLTPMGFGLTAFDDAAAAQFVADEWDGEVLTFAQVQEAGVTMPGMGSSMQHQH
jgi:copper chaperone NosL